MNVQPTFTQPEPPKPPNKENQDTFSQVAKQRMAEATTLPIIAHEAGVSMPTVGNI